jgi:tetratricopeptide (TPR) repeat protein
VIGFNTATQEGPVKAKWLYIVILITLFLWRSTVSFTQIPDRFENLQVLPKDISKKELVDLMRSYTRALGQSCEYCHVGKERDLSTFNFASDDKVPKKTARAMIQMAHAINEQYLSKIPSTSKPKVNVSCATCHHGQARPEAVEDVIRAEINESGVESAVKKYKELRNQYYGGYVFDFTEGPLNRLSMELSEKEKLSDAVSILRLNAEFHPSSARLELLLGDILLKSGMKEEAVVHYRKSLELEPDNELLKKKIQELSEVTAKPNQ